MKIFRILPFFTSKATFQTLYSINDSQVKDVLMINFYWKKRFSSVRKAQGRCA